MVSKFELIEAFLQEQVVSLANQIDRQPQALKTALQGMGDRSLLALKVPVELGGSGLTELDYRRLQIVLARASGALTFLQTQHQSAVNMLAKSHNKSLQQEFLPHVATGKSLIGVGFSHLRRPVPMMTAEETRGGYLLTGEVPWITGYDFFSHFILGANLPDGSEIYLLFPFQNSLQESGGKITLSQPMELMAMAATNTVSAKIEQWFLNSDRLVSLKPPGSIHHSSRQNILNHGFFALGCAYAGLDILSTVAEKKQLDFLQQSWQSLNEKVAKCEAQVITSLSDSQSNYPKRLKLRGKTINLAARCSMAAVIASGGGANYLNSNAARVYREALLFSVSGQTNDVMQVSVEKLLSQII